jgi:hypothetical protein
VSTVSLTEVRLVHHDGKVCPAPGTRTAIPGRSWSGTAAAFGPSQLPLKSKSRLPSPGDAIFGCATADEIISPSSVRCCHTYSVRWSSNPGLHNQCGRNSAGSYSRRIFVTLCLHFVSDEIGRRHSLRPLHTLHNRRGNCIVNIEHKTDSSMTTMRSAVHQPVAPLNGTSQPISSRRDQSDPREDSEPLRTAQSLQHRSESIDHKILAGTPIIARGRMPPAGLA